MRYSNLDGLVIPHPNDKRNPTNNPRGHYYLQKAEAKLEGRLESAVLETYQVIVRPGEKYWILEIPGIGFTQARTTAELKV